jgi:hypothetical protein
MPWNVDTAISAPTVMQTTQVQRKIDARVEYMPKSAQD